MIPIPNRRITWPGSRMLIALTLLLGVAGMLIAPAAAQPTLPDLPPAYTPGTLLDLPTPAGDSTFTARLLGATGPAVYALGTGVSVWVAADLEAADIAGIDAEAFSTRLAETFVGVRLRTNFYAGRTVAGLGITAAIDPADLLPVPDGDFDNGLRVIFVADLPPDAAPVLLATDGGERLYVRYDAFDDADGRQIVFALTRAYFDLVLMQTNPALPDWVANAWLESASLESQRLTRAVNEHLDNTITPLLDGTTNEAIGGRALFLSYLQARYGQNMVRELLNASGDGLAVIDEALRNAGAVDLVTGSTPTGLEVFGDYVMASAINFPFGDGRFQLFGFDTADDSRPRATARFANTLPFQAADSLPAFGTVVVQYNATQSVDLGLTFTSADRLPAGTGWLVQYFHTGITGVTPPRMRRWLTPDAGIGTSPVALTVPLAEAEILFVTITLITPLTDNSLTAAAYTLELN